MIAGGRFAGPTIERGGGMSISPTLVWFLVGLVLILMEIPVPGVILVFFGLGAWLVAIATALGLTEALSTQLLLFAFSSLFLLFLLRRWVRRRFHGHVTGEQNPDVDWNEFVGRPVLVLEDIPAGGAGGHVEFKGASWSAVSDEALQKGDQAEIEAVEGITLRVKKSAKGGSS
jgi:membrane protein implicated in regulation of membrane protease activity